MTDPRDELPETTIGAASGGIPNDPLLETSTGAEGADVLAHLEHPPGGEAALGDSLKDVGPSRSLASDAWRRFRRNRLAMLGLALVIFMILVGLVGPMLVQDPLDTGGLSKEAPTNQHGMGTDGLGRDVFARVVHGIRLSLLIGFLASLSMTVIGITYGAISGWYRGWADTIMMRIVDILFGIPYLVLALVFVTILGRGVSSVIITLSITAWLQTARVVRAGVLEVRELEYVDAARALGVPTRRILRRHVRPTVFQPVIVLMAVGIGSAMIAEAALSFLGVGIQKPEPSLGLMVNEAQTEVTQHFYLLAFPSLAIVLCVLGFMLIGDGLRDALDVKDV